MRWDLLGEVNSSRLRWQLEQISRESKKLGPEHTARDECVLEFLPTYRDRVEPRPTGTLKDLVDYSPDIFLGRVTALASGFYSGYLGTLLEVEVGDSYKTPPEDGPSHLYVFIETAEVTVQGSKVCMPGHRPLPAVGAQFLLFHWRKASFDPLGSFMVPIDDEIFLELEDKSASLPVRMSTVLGGLDYAIPFEELLQRTENQLRQEGER